MTLIIDPFAADQIIKKMIIWHSSGFLMILMDSWRFLWIAVTFYGFLEILRYSYGLVLIARDSYRFLWIPMGS